MERWVVLVFISLNQKFHVEVDDLIIESLTILLSLDFFSGDLQIESAT